MLPPPAPPSAPGPWTYPRPSAAWAATEPREVPGPRSTTELRQQAWHVLTHATEPITAKQLADRARITDGAALTWLTGWTRTGHARQLPGSPPAAGAYAVRYQPTDPTSPLPQEIPVPTPTPATTRVSAEATALLDHVLSHAARGWHLFPLRPGTKRPAFPDHTAQTCTGADPRCGSVKFSV